MELSKAYLEGNSEFSSYDDFFNNCRINVPENFNFVRDIVDRYAKDAPQKTALVWCNDEGLEERFDFKTLSQKSISLAKGLSSLGIKKGDVVMLVLHRRFEYWFFVLALHRLGAVPLPVPSQLHSDDFEYRIKASSAKMVVASAFGDTVLQIENAASKFTTDAPLLLSVNFTKEGWVDYSSIKDVQDSVAPDFAPVSPQDPLIMYFTSGTTDKPKLVVHNGYYPLAHIITAKYWQCVQYDGLHYSAVETGWAKASWGTIYGQWIAGSAVFVYDRSTFSPESLLEKIKKYRVTTFCAAPTIYRYLAHMELQKYDLSSLTHCTSAGETLRPDVYRLFYEKTGLKIYEGYGQTETALLAANFGFPDEQEEQRVCNVNTTALSMGKFTPLYNLQILDEEIVIKLGKEQPLGLMTTHFDSEYYHTGDLAVKDENGRIWFKGRKDNIIKSSGFRISPFEVESVLQKHPAVMECLVFGQEDEARGQVVKALVVPLGGIEPTHSLERELIEFMRTHTAMYKCPRKIEFVKKLPKTYNGKIKRYNKDEE